MLCPKCGYENPENAAECSDCGVIFGKIVNSVESGKWNVESKPGVSTPEEPIKGDDRLTPSELASALVLGNEEAINPFVFGGRVLAFLLFLIWGMRFVFASMDSPAIGASFLHKVDLVFHEAGHILFIPFGSFMTILGGSLLQVLVPFIFTVAFLLFYRNPFAASVTFWWVGQSLIDIAPYINDARDRQLMLLGGITGRDNSTVHDWYNILSRLDLLRFDHPIASTVKITGALIILTALVWGAVILYRQWGNIDSRV